MNRQIIGSTIEGKFKLLSLLGEGGLGTVFKAEQSDLNRLVALKLINEESDTENQQRFEREARILATLTNEHIVQVYSFGKTESGSPYLAMEFVEGLTLQKRLQQGPLAWKRCVEIGIELCSGLQAAHSAGVIHRDLKPQNIMLTPAPHRTSGELVKVLDFGLSKITSSKNAAEIQRLTQTGALIGSVHYMSPETCTGQLADARSDIYAVGCILFQCLTGFPPFDCDNPIGLLHKHQTETPPRIDKNSLNGAPAQLELAILKAIQKNPEQRFQTASELEAVLRLIASGKAGEVDLTDISPSRNVGTGTGAAIAILLLLTMIAGAGILILNFRKNSDHQTTQPLKPIYDSSERQKNIEAAKALIRDAEKHQVQTDQKKVRLAQKVLRTIGHRYPTEYLNQRYAVEDIAVLKKLSALSTELRTDNAEELAAVLELIRANDLDYINAEQKSEFALAMAHFDTLFGYPPYGTNLLAEQFSLSKDQKTADYYLAQAWKLAKLIKRPASYGTVACRIYECEVPFLTATNRGDQARVKIQEWKSTLEKTYRPGNIYRIGVLQALFLAEEKLNMFADARETLARIVQTLHYEIEFANSNHMWDTHLSSAKATEDSATSELMQLQVKTTSTRLKGFIDDEITKMALGARYSQRFSSDKLVLVTWAYTHLFGERPSKMELNALSNDTWMRPLPELVLQLSEGEEFKKQLGSMSAEKQLTYLYMHLLGRVPDQQGRAAFLPRLQKGELEFVVKLIVLSAEFTAIAKEVEQTLSYKLLAEANWTYKRGLDHEPGDIEWKQLLQKNKNKAFCFAEELDKIAASDEFKDKLHKLTGQQKIHFVYQHSLGHQAEPERLADCMKDAKTDEELISKVFNKQTRSDEFRSQLKLLPFAKDCADLALRKT